LGYDFLFATSVERLGAVATMICSPSKRISKPL